LKLDSRNSGEIKRVYELDEYKPAEGLIESEETEYKTIEKPGPKLNAFITSAKALGPNFQFLFSNFSVP